jgi:hypothetical protein
MDGANLFFGSAGAGGCGGRGGSVLSVGRQDLHGERGARVKWSRRHRRQLRNLFRWLLASRRNATSMSTVRPLWPPGFCSMVAVRLPAFTSPSASRSASKPMSATLPTRLWVLRATGAPNATLSFAQTIRPGSNFIPVSADSAIDKPWARSNRPYVRRRTYIRCAPYPAHYGGRCCDR